MIKCFNFKCFLWMFRVRFEKKNAIKLFLKLCYFQNEWYCILFSFLTLEFNFHHKQKFKQYTVVKKKHS